MLLLVIALLAGACTGLSEEVTCALPPEPSIEVPRPVDLDGGDAMGDHAVALADAYGIDRLRIRWAVDLSWTRLPHPRVVASGDVADEDKVVSIETVDAAVTWVDSLTDDDGVLLVPESAGQQAAWEAVKNLPGCPTQTLVRKAQAVRKARG